ncbi:MAG: 50S ribosomal protein L29 [Crocinitomicaceae bacterium]|jgi:large subunit ribosomal protein L29|nr:MAG: 50S ribosomal protein L29 [Crocinitomicaceae bacterium]
MKQQEITKLSLDEVKSRIEGLVGQLAKIKVNHKVTPLENPSQIRKMRREVAQLNTELTKREKQA